MVSLSHLTKQYGAFTAVDGLSFDVREGEVLGLLGPNGAGKTTTLRMVTGFLPPSSGRVRIAGDDLLDQPIRAKRNIGYLLCLGSEGAPTASDKARYVKSARRTPLVLPLCR